jgi:hypothetical protein
MSQYGGANEMLQAGFLLFCSLLLGSSRLLCAFVEGAIRIMVYFLSIY